MASNSMWLIMSVISGLLAAILVLFGLKNAEARVIER